MMALVSKSTNESGSNKSGLDKANPRSVPASVDMSDRPIVFFDGECVLCNGFVDLLLKLDLEGTMAIASLQGQTARQHLPPLPNNREQWSIFYEDKTGIYSQSDAVIHVCRRLGAVWALLSGVISLVPPFLRDGVYRLIARNRYRLFGQNATCRMPSDSDKDRFLP